MHAGKLDAVVCDPEGNACSAATLRIPTTTLPIPWGTMDVVPGGGIVPNIVSVTGRLNAPALRDLLSLSIGYPTAEKIERICRQHVEDRRRDVIGYEDGNAVLGMLGYQQTALYAAVITHLAVDPAWQRRGIARSLLAYLI